MTLLNKPLFQIPVFTDEGIGWLEGEDVITKECHVTLAGSGKSLILPRLDIRSVDEEFRVKAYELRDYINAQADAVLQAVSLKQFPDMSKVEIPSEGARRLPKGLRQIAAHGVHRPETLPPSMLAHLLSVQNAVRIRLAWGPPVDIKFRELCSELGVIDSLPKNARPLDSEEETAAKGYVWFPLSVDERPFVVIPVADFHPKYDKPKPGIVEIGNIRLALGLLKMGFKLTSVTKTKEEEEIPALLGEMYV